MTDNNPLITELKAHRQRLALSASDVAIRSGLDEMLLSRWEDGASSPSLDGVQKWASALGLKLALIPSEQEARRGIRADWQKRRITVDGVPVRLTPMEWRVIERLARTPGALVSHQELYRYVYGEDWNSRGQATAVRVLITKLRRLLPLQIEARWGQGYTLTGIEAAPLDAAAAEPVSPDEPHRGTGEDPVPQKLRGAEMTKLLARSTRSLRPTLLRSGDTVTRQTVTAQIKPSTCRAEELGVIERFLAERGVTRCPDVGTIEKSPLPALVWDKVKRKWVRPPAQELRVG
jgi:transcriptional regulator with XRE-family HTH domain